RRHDRKWPDPGGAWRGALAADRSGAMDLRGIPHHNRQADAQPGAASHGYRKLSARPRHHAQAEGAIGDFKKTSPRAWRQLRARRRLTPTEKKSGPPTGPAPPRKKRPPAAGPSAAPVQAHRGTNGPLPPTSSVQSARRGARVQP